MQITVRGSATHHLHPEQARITLTIQHTTAHKQEALRATQRTAADVVAELKRLQSAEGAPLESYVMERVRTSVWRKEDAKGRPLPSEFSATVTITALFSDFSEMSEFLAAWGGLEGLSIDHIEWLLTEATRRDRTADVLTEAVAAARQRAQVIAEATGCTRVEFVRVGEGDDEDLRVPFAAPRMLAGGAPSLEFQPEDLRLTETITAVFDAS